MTLTSGLFPHLQHPGVGLKETVVSILVTVIRSFFFPSLGSQVNPHCGQRCQERCCNMGSLHWLERVQRLGLNPQRKSLFCGRTQIASFPNPPPLTRGPEEGGIIICPPWQETSEPTCCWTGPSHLLRWWQQVTKPNLRL